MTADGESQKHLEGSRSTTNLSPRASGTIEQTRGQHHAVNRLLEFPRGREKGEDLETVGAVTWLLTSIGRDAPGNRWKDLLKIEIPGGPLLPRQSL